jgi:hypothetical protein
MSKNGRDTTAIEQQNTDTITIIPSVQKKTSSGLSRCFNSLLPILANEIIGALI